MVTHKELNFAKVESFQAKSTILDHLFCYFDLKMLSES